jgi:hypothetical protein
MLKAAPAMINARKRLIDCFPKSKPYRAVFTKTRRIFYTPNAFVIERKLYVSVSVVWAALNQKRLLK